MERADIAVSVRHARHDRNAPTDSNVVPEARGEPQPRAANRGRVSVLEEEPLVQPLYHPIVSKSDSPLEKETPPIPRVVKGLRSEEHTSELQSLTNLVCRLLLEKKKQNK